MANKKGYGQFCPVAKAAEIVAERWTPLVLRELIAGSHRFNEMHRGVPLMSTALLSQRLRELVDAGVIERRRGEGRGWEYFLTEAGEDLQPIIESLGFLGRPLGPRTAAARRLRSRPADVGHSPQYRPGTVTGRKNGRAI